MADQKIHTTNYFDTLIEVAEDTKVTCGTRPPSRGDQKTIAARQYELLAGHPYQLTSDEVLFQVFADRSGLAKAEYPDARQQFFSKGQPCFRASPLTKNYGFGIHADHEGKMALYGMETEAYEKLKNDPEVKKVKAMRSARK